MANPQLFFVLAKVSVPQLRILCFFFLFSVNRPIEMQIIQIKGGFVSIFDYINLVGNQFNMDPVRKELSWIQFLTYFLKLPRKTLFT